MWHIGTRRGEFLIFQEPKTGTDHFAVILIPSGGPHAPDELLEVLAEIVHHGRMAQ